MCASESTNELKPLRLGEPSPRVLRFIRSAAHLSLISMLALWVLMFLIEGKPYDQVWQVVLAQCMGGRAGGVGLGLQKGFSPYYLFFHSTMYDFIIMLYVYPLFVSGYQYVSNWPFIGKFFKKTHALALQHKKHIAPYGAIGLMLFVVFPFWSTGPLVGVIVGYLIGLRTWVTFSAVIIGNMSAVAAWIWAYDRLQSWSPKLALVLLIIIFVLAMGGTFFARFRRAHRHKDAVAHEEVAEKMTVGSEEPKD